jgi:hypothetical protein
MRVPQAVIAVEPAAGNRTAARMRAHSADNGFRKPRRSAWRKRRIPITAASADGTRRTIIIRPTSRQDALYYAARRQAMVR